MGCHIFSERHDQDSWQEPSYGSGAGGLAIAKVAIGAEQTLNKVVDQ